MPILAAKNRPSKCSLPVALLGGAARPGCHHFGVTPYYKAKPYPYWFVVKIFFPPSFELKTNQFSGEDFFFLFVLELKYFWTENSRLWRQWPFFLVFTYFWTEKGWHHEIPPPVPPFLATPLQLTEANAAHLLKFNEAVSDEWLIYFLTLFLRHFFFTQISKLNNYEYLAALS